MKAKANVLVIALIVVVSLPVFGGGQSESEPATGNTSEGSTADNNSTGSGDAATAPDSTGGDSPGADTDSVPVFEIDRLSYRSGTSRRFDWASWQYEVGNLELAERAALATLRYEPDALEPLWLLAHIYRRQGKLGKMMDIFAEIGLRPSRESSVARRIILEGSNGYVLSNTGDYIYTDLGESSGISVDDELVIYQDSAVLRHPVTLDIVTVARPRVGTVRVEAVYPNYSVAELVDADTEVARGMRAIPVGAYDQFEGSLAQVEIGDDIEVQLPETETPAREPEEEPEADEPQNTSAPPSMALQTILRSVAVEADGLVVTAPEAAIERDGMVYVADTGNNRIVKLDQEGTSLAAAGFEGAGPLEFRAPSDLAFFQDRLVVVDRLNHRLQVLSKDLEFVQIVGSRGTGFGGMFEQPTRVQAHGDRLIVLDAGNRRVQVFDAEFQLVSTFGQSEIENITVSMAVSPEGTVYVLDYLAAELGAFELETGRLIQKAPLPEDLAGRSIQDIAFAWIDGTPSLVCALDREHRLVVLDTEQMVVMAEHGSRGVAEGRFNEPVSIDIGEEGAVTVVERGGVRLQHIRGSM